MTHTMNFAEAALLWARSAGTAGAWMPAAVPDILEEIAHGPPHEMLVALVERAGRLAYDRWRAAGSEGPQPRGCVLEYRAGVATALVWTSSSHEVRMYHASGGGWCNQVLCYDPDHGPDVGGCPRELGGEILRAWMAHDEIGVLVTEPADGLDEIGGAQ